MSSILNVINTGFPIQPLFDQILKNYTRKGLGFLQIQKFSTTLSMINEPTKNDHSKNFQTKNSKKSSTDPHDPNKIPPKTNTLSPFYFPLVSFGVFSFYLFLKNSHLLKTEKVSYSFFIREILNRNFLKNIVILPGIFSTPFECISHLLHSFWVYFFRKKINKIYM